MGGGEGYAGACVGGDFDRVVGFGIGFGEFCPFFSFGGGGLGITVMRERERERERERFSAMELKSHTLKVLEILLILYPSDIRPPPPRRASP